jgi:hypothetical protein
MEQLLITVILGLPNFAVAAVVLFQQWKLINKLLKNQQTLIEYLWKMADQSKSVTADDQP